MNDANQSPASTSGLFAIGDLVIMRDGERVVVTQIINGPVEPQYVVQLADGEQQAVEADGLIRARTYADWVAPGSGWDGQERRKTPRTPDESSDWPGQERRRP